MLGAVSTLAIMPFIIWYYVIIFSFFIEFIISENKNKVIICAIIYLSALEILARMVRASPLIPYEISKYVLTFFLSLGILLRPVKPSKGWWMLLAVIPAMFYDLSNKVEGYMPIVFNLLGPVAIALAIVYFRTIRMTTEQLIKCIRLLFWALVSALIFTILKTPSYDELEFTLSANFNTSGGFGSNQVSSALGLGFFILFISLFQGWNLSGNRILDGSLMIIFLFQSIMTFSRGGVIGGMLGILVVILFILLKKSRKASKVNLNLVKFISIIFAISYFIFSITNRITGGMVINRYLGETAGTLSGTKDQSLNNMTSNRFDILLGDLELWSNHPIFGVGLGASRYLRLNLDDLIAHVEFSRLIAEHGLLGFVYFVLLISVGIDIIKVNSSYKSLNGYFLVGLFSIAFFTTFHSGTRTFISPLLIGISCIHIIPNIYLKN
jgi:hypothetical protein